MCIRDSGYTMSNGKIVIDEKEAEVIRQIFHDYRCGMTMSELATRLTNHSVPYCEKRVDWNKSVIARIIDNEKYTGLGDYLPIVGIKDYREPRYAKLNAPKNRLSKMTAISV